MPETPDNQRQPIPPVAVRWRAIAVSAVILAVFGGVVAAVSLQLRGHWRAQVLGREGEVVRAVAAMERTRIADAAREQGLPALDEPFEIALQTSRNWKGVLAVRLFDFAGAFLDSVPVEVYEGALAPTDLRALATGEPLVRFRREFPVSDLFIAGEGNRASLLEVNVALAPSSDEPSETVIAQYWIDGTDLATELAALDRRVLEQALAAFGAGALLISGSLLWGFRRLQVANRLLRERADDLARANRELAQSARSAAIGSITAHLMHGLRNPLSGLESFVASQAGEAGSGEEWASARESTRRLRTLVNEVHGVLSDVQSGTDFEVTSSELCAGLCERLQGTAAKRGVRLEVAELAGALLDARAAGLGGLVLANLAQNAIEASPSGSRVLVTVSRDDAFADFIVSDHGPGLSDAVAADPFRPRRSSKPDGAGIGLAISWELARHAGGELTLVRTNREGAAFRLRLPTAVTRPAREVR